MTAHEHLKAAERIVLDALQGCDMAQGARIDALEASKVAIWKTMDLIPEEL
jgi:hypothetical protein